MAAIITDQFRILNAETFVKSFTGIGTTTNVYYTFIGLPNSTDTVTGSGTTDWNTNVPNPKDMFKEQNDYYDTMIALKRVNSSDLRRMVRKVTWAAGTTYDMYKDTYSSSNPAPVTNATSLYDSNFYIVNSNYKVYICLNNGMSPDFPSGKPSIDEPDFTDLEPRAAGTSGDGYIWKYLYTISPSDIIKFDSIDYMPVPSDWGSGQTAEIKNNAINGEIKTVIIENSGAGYQPIGTSFKNVPILGDGTGGRVTVTVDNSGKVSNVEVTSGGTGYTRGRIQFYPGAPGSEIGGAISGLSAVGTGTTSVASFEVIIPPQGGHGYDVYKELGAYRVLVYSRFETTTSNPDFIIGNDFARVGLLKNPTVYGSKNQLLTASEVSAVGGVKLKSLTGGNISDTTYSVDSTITQTTGIGSTAAGIVAAWDNATGVLKYYQPVGLGLSSYGFRVTDFTDAIGYGGTYIISGASIGSNLGIDTSFGSSANPGTATTIGSGNNTRLVPLGLRFINGVAPPEVEKYSGEIIYIDNRAAIPRSSTQKEDIKIVLEF